MKNLSNLWVVNIFGEPGSGKSVAAADTFAVLSKGGYNAEIVVEVAKKYIWEANLTEEGSVVEPYIFTDQLYLFANQNRSLRRLVGRQEIAIMECPLLMSAIYKRDDDYDGFDELILNVHNSYRNINIFLERGHEYVAGGRLQNELETMVLRKRLMDYLDKNNISFFKIKSSQNVGQEIANIVLQKMQE